MQRAFLRLNIGDNILPDAFLGDILFAGARRAARSGDKGNGFLQPFCINITGDDAAPASANFCAQERPIPVAAPVISATLPLQSFKMSSG